MYAWIYCQDPFGMGPGPTYLVQRLSDPGGPTYSSRSSVPMDIDKLGNLKFT